MTATYGVIVSVAKQSRWPAPGIKRQIRTSSGSRHGPMPVRCPRCCPYARWRIRGGAWGGRETAPPHAEHSSIGIVHLGGTLLLLGSFEEMTMSTRLKIFAIAAALAAGTSGTAMAQYACPTGYAYSYGYCRPVPAPGYPAGRCPARRPGRRTVPRTALRQPVPSVRSSAEPSAPLPARLPVPPTRSLAPWRRRPAAQDIPTITAAAIRAATRQPARRRGSGA